MLKPETKGNVKPIKNKIKNATLNGTAKSNNNKRESIIGADDGVKAENGVVFNCEENDSNSLNKRIVNINSEKKGIIFENTTAVWTSLGEYNKNGIFNMNINIEPGVLCVLVGQVGSGKSTLLNVILGELEVDSGSVTINGRISYASQEAFLFEGTVRDNIVFVEAFDENRYNEVIKVCALEQDLRLLPKGDETIVGERGVSLSGGQRARVNLARAIYKQADIYLLDDPLSAVDAHVGKHIFDKCIRDYLSEKTCVLVTHQLQYLQKVKHVVLLSNGKIEAQGPFRTLERINGDLLANMQEETNQENADTFEKRVKSRFDHFYG